MRVLWGVQLVLQALFLGILGDGLANGLSIRDLALTRNATELMSFGRWME